MQRTKKKNHSIRISRSLFLLFIFLLPARDTFANHFPAGLKTDPIPTPRSYTPEKYPQSSVFRRSICRRVKGAFRETTSFTELEPLRAEFIDLLAEYFDLENKIQDVASQLAASSPSGIRIVVVNAKYKVVLALELLRRSKALAYEDLNISEWMQRNRKQLSEYYREIGFPSSDEIEEVILPLFSSLLEKITKERDFEDRISGVYLFDFLVKLGKLNKEDAKPEEITGETIHNILKLTENIPGVFRYGEIKDNDPGGLYAYEKNQLFLDKDTPYDKPGLLRRDLRIFAEFLFRSGKKGSYVLELTQIEVNAWSLDIDIIKDELRRFKPNLILENKPDYELRSRWKDAKIEQLIGEDINKYVQDNLPNLRRYAQAMFELKLSNGKRLFDSLPAAGVEELLAKLMQTYLLANLEEEEKSAYSDFYEFANRDKNGLAEHRLPLFWKNVAPLQDKWRKAGERPLQIKKYTFKLLIKKMLLGGDFDVGTGENPQEVLERQLEAHTFPLSISVFEYFWDTVIKGKPEVTLIINLDNNGEVIDVLDTFQYLLEQLNPNATLIFVPKSIPVRDDIYKNALEKIFELDRESGRNNFSFLIRERGKKVQVLKDGPKIQGTDWRHLGDSFLEALTGKKSNGKKSMMGKGKRFLINIGAAHFLTTTQENFVPEIDKFFLTSVKYRVLEGMTGIKARARPHHPLIFAFLPQGRSFGQGPHNIQGSDPWTDEPIWMTELTLLRLIEQFRREGKPYYKEDILPP